MPNRAQIEDSNDRLVNGLFAIICILALVCLIYGTSVFVLTVTNGSEAVAKATEDMKPIITKLFEEGVSEDEFKKALISSAPDKVTISVVEEMPKLRKDKKVVNYEIKAVYGGTNLKSYLKVQAVYVDNILDEVDIIN